MPPQVQVNQGQQEALLRLAEAMKIAFDPKSKTVSLPPKTPYLHGPNGLWSVSGAERPVISTRIIPRGLASIIPARANNSEYPMYPYFTGYTSHDLTTRPSLPCDDAPEPGSHKNAFQTATFGRYTGQTRTIDLTRLGQVVNRSEFTDFYLVNDPLGMVGGNNITTPGVMPGAQSLTNEVSSRFAEVGAMFQERLSKQLWEGNPANNTAGGGYAEFPGLDMLVGTGKKDAITGAAVASLDSMIINANYKRVSDATGDDNLVNVLTYTMRLLQDRATRSGLAPVRWVLAMRETMFYELSAVWPCNYLSYRCSTTDATNVSVMSNDVVAMRDDMRQNQYLIVDGVRFDVVFDDAITEYSDTTNANVPKGSFSSSIKILPLSILGGSMASLFWEYFAWNGPGAALSPEVRAASPLLENFFWTDGGFYLWHFKPPINWCVQWIGIVKPRVVLLTPHLAASVNNILYKPLMHTREPYSNQPYFVNGGATSRTTAPSLYASWS